MRPTYERSGDLANEAKAKIVIESWSKSTLFKAAKFAHWDFEAYRNRKRVAFIELKVRKNAMAKYPTYMISKAKWDNLISTSQFHNTPALLVVQWIDRMGYVVVNEFTPVVHSEGGRVDRGDPKDVESVVLINIREFKEIPNEIL